LVCGTTPIHTVGVHEVVEVAGIDGIPAREVSLKNAVIIMEERLKEIASIVKAEIVRAGYDNQLISGIVLTGGTANIKNIDKIFAKVTDMHVRVGTPRNILKSTFQGLNNPKYSTALGLVWSQFRKLDDRIPENHQQIATNNTEPLKDQKPEKRKGIGGWLKKVMGEDTVKGDEY
jgi:cell division protein FtsA